MSELNMEEMDIDGLLRLLNQNKTIDPLLFDFQNEENLAQLDFTGMKKKQLKVMLSVKALQRLLRVIPDNDQELAISMMKIGLHSALQIAAMTRNDFLKKCVGLMEKELADSIYQNAKAKRSTILIQYMNALQNNEPHISAARFN